MAREYYFMFNLMTHTNISVYNTEEDLSNIKKEKEQDD